jgi:NAD(P)-dependent dehydrogenase (short-subunit alcohol dehydrogenase family)
VTRQLEGRSAIVTGASRGLGRTIALRLANEGASIGVVARTETEVDDTLPGTIYETVAAIEREGGRAIAIAADLADEEDLARIVHEAHEQFGPIDLLVNNAALTVGGRPRSSPAPVETNYEVRLNEAPSILNVSLRSYRRHFAINVFAPYQLMQSFLPDMVFTGRGSIINVSSRAAFNPGEGPYKEPGRPALFGYGSSKAALHVLTQAAAVEMSDRQIAINVLIPSQPILTPGTKKLLKDQDVPAWASDEGFADAVLRLAILGPSEATGRILFHQDVLNSEDPRSWPSAHR